MVYVVQVTVSGFVFFISPQEFVAESSIQDHFVMNGKIYIYLSGKTFKIAWDMWISVSGIAQTSWR